MSYAIYDSRGYVDDVASGGGWADFRQAAQADSPGKETEALIESGASDNPQDLAEELRAAKFADPSADSVREEIAKAAEQCEDAAIISDGVGHE